MAIDVKVLDSRDIKQAIAAWVDNGCKTHETHVDDVVELKLNGPSFTAWVHK